MVIQQIEGSTPFSMITPVPWVAGMYVVKYFEIAMYNDGELHNSWLKFDCSSLWRCMFGVANHG